MLLSKQDFLSDYPENPFLLAHLDCKILYDKDNTTFNLLERIKREWSQSNLSDSEISLYRFTFKHVLDKLRHRLHENVLYTKYFMYSSVDWFLSCYARIKGWEVGKPKLHLSMIEKNEQVLFEIIQKLYSEDCLEEQFKLLTQCAEYMLDSLGALWKEDEVLFHLLPQGSHDETEQNRGLNILGLN